MGQMEGGHISDQASLRIIREKGGLDIVTVKASWQIGPRTVGPWGPVVRGPTVRPKKVANWALDSWAPGPSCPGPNCPP